jgi:hypothetical protein
MAREWMAIEALGGQTSPRVERLFLQKNPMRRNETSSHTKVTFAKMNL